MIDSLHTYNSKKINFNSLNKISSKLKIKYIAIENNQQSSVKYNEM